MANRYHIPVVVTTADEMTKAETVEYVESILRELEQIDEVHRTYIEDNGIDEAEARRLLDMLENVNDDNISDAIDAIDTLRSDD